MLLRAAARGAGIALPLLPRTAAPIFFADYFHIPSFAHILFQPLPPLLADTVTLHLYCHIMIRPDVADIFFDVLFSIY
jgi:hypothetical protein